MSQADKSNTTSRRALLAGAPAAALAIGTAVNGLAIAAGGLPTQAGDDAELLALAVRFDPLFDEWVRQKKAASAISDDFEERLQRATGLTRAEAAPLRWEDPAWNAYHDMIGQISRMPDRVRWDEAAWVRLRDEMYPDEILSFDAESIAGIKLQVRALMAAYDDETWASDDDGPVHPAMSNFIQSVCAFTGVPFPPL
jgi:hypothetical protein